MLAPILFLVLHRFPKIGVFWNLLLVLIGIVICIIPRMILDIPFIYESMEFKSIWTTINLVRLYYWRADPHLVSYALGFFGGYLIRKKPNLYFGGRIGELFLWVVSSSLTLYSILWSNQFWKPYYHLTKTEVILFLAFCKLMYLCGWFWMIYACATGRGGMFRYRIFCSLFLYSFVRFYQSVL